MSTACWASTAPAKPPSCGCSAPSSPPPRGPSPGTGRTSSPWAAPIEICWGICPRTSGYYPDFSVQDYLLYIASIKGLRPATARAEDAKPAGRGGAHPGPAAENEKALRRYERRAGIAQAMLNDPKILYPGRAHRRSGPHLASASDFRNLISELAEDRLVLLSTHIVRLPMWKVHRRPNPPDRGCSWSATAPASSPAPARGPHPGVDLHRPPGPGGPASPPVSRGQPQNPPPRGPAAGALPGTPPRRRPIRRR